MPAQLRSFVYVCLFFLAGAACAADPVFKFDFGWKELAAPQGFVKVTRESTYTNTVRWGFSGREYWGGGYSGRFPCEPNAVNRALDEIARDGLWLSGTFLVDVPNGNYLVWYQEGDLGTYALQPIADHLNYGLSIGGKEVRKPRPFDKELFRQEYFRGVNDDYRRGEDVFDRYVAPLMDDQAVAVTVTNGQLTVAGSGCNLCGLMIYPAPMQAQFDAEVAALRKHRRDFFYSVVKVQEPKEEGQPASVSDTDTQRGYQIWPRNKMRTVGPNTRPEAEELGDTMKAFAARDQGETATFAVRPFVDLHDAKVTVSDLVSPEGGKIAREDIRVRILFYRVRFDGQVVPSHLPAFTTADLPKEITKQFWLTFPVAANAKPGIYSGTVTFAAAEHPATTLGFKVKVLPFVLRDVYQDARFVMQDAGPARYTYQMAAEFPG